MYNLILNRNNVPYSFYTQIINVKGLQCTYICSSPHPFCPFYYVNKVVNKKNNNNCYIKHLQIIIITSKDTKFFFILKCKVKFNKERMVQSAQHFFFSLDLRNFLFSNHVPFLKNFNYKTMEYIFMDHHIISQTIYYGLNTQAC